MICCDPKYGSEPGRPSGADIHDLEQRRTLFEENGIGFVSANFNSLTPFPEIGDESFDVVILTQVIEHIPNLSLIHI